ncbi:MAG: biotin--[acetyl-CoA-carboxylase] ligase [Alphaproteobacteria bacterium]
MEWALQTYETLSSTQDLIKQLAAENAQEGTAVQAREQTAGRGRHGRTWISEAGNLYLSLLLRPHTEPRYTGQLALLTALAVTNTLQGFVSEPGSISLKWPNDVLIDGKKCAGILLETELKDNSSLEYVAVGTGMNIRTAAAEHATCLWQHNRDMIPVDRVRDIFLSHFSTLYESWINPDFEMIRAQWLRLGHKPGDPVQVKIGEKAEKGTFYDIDMYGNMLLKTGNNQIRIITSGDVYI